MRCLDKEGKGWIKTNLKKVHSLTKLSERSIKRHLSTLKILGWIQDYETKSTTEGLMLWAKYTSHKTLKVREGGSYGVASKKLLVDTELLASRATLIATLAIQHVVEGKALYKLRKSDKTLLDSTQLNRVEMERSKRNKSKSVQSATGSLTYTAKPDQATFGISQEYIARKLNLSVGTVQKRLATAKRIRIVKEVEESTFFNLADCADTNKDSNIELKKHILRADGVIVRRMPFVYLDKMITKKAHRRRLQALKAKATLTPQQWEVARLAAITKSYGYSDKGAELVIESTSLSRFKRNTYALTMKNPYKPDLSKYDDMSGANALRVNSSYSSPEFIDFIDD